MHDFADEQNRMPHVMRGAQATFHPGAAFVQNGNTGAAALVIDAREFADVATTAQTEVSRQQFLTFG
jgi:hypothetical protein